MGIEGVVVLIAVTVIALILGVFYILERRARIKSDTVREMVVDESLELRQALTEASVLEKDNADMKRRIHWQTQELDTLRKENEDLQKDLRVCNKTLVNLVNDYEKLKEELNDSRENEPIEGVGSSEREEDPDWNHLD